MKYLLLILAFAFAIWHFRSRTGQTASNQQTPQKRPESSSAQEMIACSKCGLHIPRSEALAGATGYYCCQEHRSKSEH